MAFIKFIITALAATMFASVLANPVPTGPAVATIPDSHLEKRDCNNFGCGMKCKSPNSSLCKRKVFEFSDCNVCTYFVYAADGSAVSPDIPIAKLDNFANHDLYRQNFGMRNASKSSGASDLLWLSARGARILDSPNESMADAAALRYGIGIDSRVEIWFAGT
ncbi:hypothetical protein V493_07129 [Pseudogymnoascus sp. VKM F-4281 (FW-2241)]|nr:hypothetical protein V493_07129 [Pseudogymnoascus sp. VKM F-4281 (FW-2241)]